MNQTLAILKFFKEAGYSGLYLKASVTQHNGKEPPKTGATIVFITKKKKKREGKEEKK